MKRQILVRPLARDRSEEVELVAERMRLTLMEVLGPEVGGSMYDMTWLRDRVEWHLDPTQCRGEVFLVECDGVRGHVIVRLELDEDQRLVGLISTIYVEPAVRGSGLATALLDHAEAWLRAGGAEIFATNTDENNTPLIRLFEKRGYNIVLHVTESAMVRLERGVPVGDML